MKDLLTLIAKHLVDDLDQVVVNEIDGVNTLVFELSVAKQDIGKIIGKKGSNIRGIRTIMNAASAKIHKRIIVEVLE